MSDCQRERELNKRRTVQHRAWDIFLDVSFVEGSASAPQEAHHRCPSNFFCTGFLCQRSSSRANEKNRTSSWYTWVRYMKTQIGQIFWGTTARCRFTSSSRIRTSLSPSTTRQPHQDQRINFTKDMGARTITGRLTSCQTLTLNLELSHSNSLMDIRTRIVALKVGYRCW